MLPKDLLKFRENLGISQEELAELTQVSLSTIRKHEQGVFPIPAGLARVYYGAEERVLTDRIRYLAVATKKPVTTEWTTGPWTVYGTEEECLCAIALFKEATGKERTMLKVFVRACLDLTTERELWRDAMAV